MAVLNYPVRASRVRISFSRTCSGALASPTSDQKNYSNLNTELCSVRLELSHGTGDGKFMLSLFLMPTIVSLPSVAFQKSPRQHACDTVWKALPADGEEYQRRYSLPFLCRNIHLGLFETDPWSIPSTSVIRSVEVPRRYCSSAIRASSAPFT